MRTRNRALLCVLMALVALFYVIAMVRVGGCRWLPPTRWVAAAGGTAQPP